MVAQMNKFPSGLKKKMLVGSSGNPNTKSKKNRDVCAAMRVNLRTHV